MQQDYGGLKLLRLNMDQLKDEEDFITIRLIGKGNKERLVYLNNGARDFLNSIPHCPWIGGWSVVLCRKEGREANTRAADN